MIFEIDFNRVQNDTLLQELGAKMVDTGSTKYPPFERLEIELNTFEELEELIKKVDTYYNDLYSAIISFDRPIIYLDNYV